MLGHAIKEAASAAAEGLARHFTPYTPLRLNHSKPALDDYFMSEVYNEYDDNECNFMEDTDIDNPRTAEYDLKNILGLSSCAAATLPSDQTVVPKEPTQSSNTPDTVLEAGKNLPSDQDAASKESTNSTTAITASEAPASLPPNQTVTSKESIESATAPDTVPAAHTATPSTDATGTSPPQANKAEKDEKQKAFDARQLQAAEAVAKLAIEKVRARQAWRKTVGKHVQEQDELRKEHLRARGLARDQAAKDRWYKTTLRVMRASNPKNSLSSLPQPLPALKSSITATKSNQISTAPKATLTPSSPKTEKTFPTASQCAIQLPCVDASEPQKSSSLQETVSASPSRKRENSPPTSYENFDDQNSEENSDHVAATASMPQEDSDTNGTQSDTSVVQQTPSAYSGQKRARQDEDDATEHHAKKPKLDVDSSTTLSGQEQPQDKGNDGDDELPAEQVKSPHPGVNAISSCAQKRPRDDQDDELAHEHRAKSPKLEDDDTVAQGQKRPRNDRDDDLAAEHCAKNPRLGDDGSATDDATVPHGQKRPRNDHDDDLAGEHCAKNPRLDDEGSATDDVDDSEEAAELPVAEQETAPSSGVDSNTAVLSVEPSEKNAESTVEEPKEDVTSSGENSNEADGSIREMSGETAVSSEASEKTAVSVTEESKETPLSIVEKSIGTDASVLEESKETDVSVSEKVEKNAVCSGDTEKTAIPTSTVTEESVSVSTSTESSSAAQSQTEPTFVIYHSTGVQTTPIPDAYTFERCHGRTPNILRNSEVGLGGRGRYTRENKDVDPFKFRYGMAFLVPSSSSPSSTSTSQGCQTMDFTEADPALAQARTQVQIDAKNLSSAAWAQGVVVSVKKDELLSHSSAIQTSVKVHGDGTVDYPGNVDMPMLFPNLAFELPPHDRQIEVVDFTSPPPSPSFFAECGDAAAPGLDAAFTASMREWEVKAKATVRTEQREEKKDKRERKDPSPPTTTAATKKRGTGPSAANTTQSVSELTVKAPSGGPRFTAANPRFPRREQAAAAAPPPTPEKEEKKGAAAAAAEPKRRKTTARKGLGVYVPPGRC
ncbi:hypothetical protein DM02DRAFT_685470 [Periconia macrospinosa]|uniref:Uncharacterized protein n=1 Tax=Periconia macrospinosa TaxID=97972 RepID=A0A2V1E694_9PLEO|nr:hypothetical protein DM02DRAFT_685470 [Periconia macrospinosa]